MPRRAWWMMVMIAGLLCAGRAVPPVICPEAPEVVVIDGVDMVPVVPLSEALGIATVVDPDIDTVTVTHAGTTVICTPGVKSLKVNGKAVKLPIALFERVHILYAPVKPLVEALGGSYALDKKAHTGTVKLPGRPAPLVLSWMNPPEYTNPLLDGPLEAATQANYRDADDELYIMNLDGTGLCRLTFNFLDDSVPAFSADGTRMVYQRGLLLGGEVHTRECATPQGRLVYGADGKLGTFFTGPMITPDGTAIYYTKFKETAKEDELQPYIVRVPFGGGPEQVIGDGLWGSLSPDNKRLATTAIDYAAEKTQVVIMDADGKHACQVTDGRDVGAIFSPDGEALLFLRHYGKDDDEKQVTTLCRLAKAGKPDQTFEAPVELRTDDHYSAIFSPDGQYILFGVSQKGIFRASAADYSGVTQLTRGDDSSPQFTLDGARVFFVRDGKLYAMTKDGGNVAPIAPDALKELNVTGFTFIPGSNRLVFTAGIAAEND